jgi:CDP-glucose 4,6-dehydratase
VENVAGLDRLAPAFRGKRALVTGHTGFKGGWLSLWLADLGAEVTGYALPPETDPDLYSAIRLGDVIRPVQGDVRDRSRLDALLRESRPDVIFHMAAQALVRRSYRQPLETFAVNAMGTAELLDALRARGERCAVVVVTSDKCYENDRSGRPRKEGDALGGEDLYSAI